MWLLGLIGLSHDWDVNLFECVTMSSCSFWLRFSLCSRCHWISYTLSSESQWNGLNCRRPYLPDLVIQRAIWSSFSLIVQPSLCMYCMCIRAECYVLSKCYIFHLNALNSLVNPHHFMHFIANAQAFKSYGHKICEYCIICSIFLNCWTQILYVVNTCNTFYCILFVLVLLHHWFEILF